MTDFKTRLKIEHDELDLKIQKLSAFIDQPVFKTLSEHERDLLVRQLVAMTQYRSILRDRLVAHK